VKTDRTDFEHENIQSLTDEEKAFIESLGTDTDPADPIEFLKLYHSLDLETKYEILDMFQNFVSP
jgi:hypothetical protein